MTLLCAILKKVKSNESNSRRYISPPPEIDISPMLNVKKKRFRKYRYAKTKSVVDSRPPKYNQSHKHNKLRIWKANALAIFNDNIHLLLEIKKIYDNGGDVDNRWRAQPPGTLKYYKERIAFLKRVERDNKLLHTIITNAKPKVVPTAVLREHWQRNRQDILDRAHRKFVLFPAVPQEDVEDPAFVASPGVRRPRVHLSLRIRDGANLGSITVELFTDACPVTCGLFLELLDGDGLGHGYVGTTFFRKVPHLYWSGGDVIADNGFGCYLQRGRRAPIAAENYHFSHSMPGLLSMKVTRNDEVCGIFNITFKPLPQFDLRNVVFGRIIRPSATYDAMQTMGSALSTRPIVVLCASERRVHGVWTRAAPNTVVGQRTVSALIRTLRR